MYYFMLVFIPVYLKKDSMIRQKRTFSLRVCMNKVFEVSLRKNQTDLRSDKAGQSKQYSNLITEGLFSGYIYASVGGCERRFDVAGKIKK